MPHQDQVVGLPLLAALEVPAPAFVRPLPGALEHTRLAGDSLQPIAHLVLPRGGLLAPPLEPRERLAPMLALLRQPGHLGTGEAFGGRPEDQLATQLDDAGASRSTALVGRRGIAERVAEITPQLVPADAGKTQGQVEPETERAHGCAPSTPLSASRCSHAVVSSNGWG